MALLPGDGNPCWRYYYMVDSPAMVPDVPTDDNTGQNLLAYGVVGGR